MYVCNIMYVRIALILILFLLAKQCQYIHTYIHTHTHTHIYLKKINYGTPERTVAFFGLHFVRVYHVYMHTVCMDAHRRVHPHTCIRTHSMGLKMSHLKCHIQMSHLKCHIRNVTSEMSHSSVTSEMSHLRCHIQMSHLKCHI
jgi:hypothetical protein